MRTAGLVLFMILGITILFLEAFALFLGIPLGVLEAVFGDGE